ncbi:hypothetical protein KW784_01185, partial [Candidatus Parcubacteria bacterium]|nr:hypothetical protein [Candidatus Parcubacteria bacterium]
MVKKFVTVLLMVSFLVPVFYLPQRTPKAEAILGFGDIVIDIKALADRIVDSFAMVLAQKFIDRIVSSTVKWAQSGFDGNPAYATDPGQYFTGIADGVAGDFIKGSDLGLLCSPFQANIRLSLTQQYYEPKPFQCTLTGVVGNIEKFYNDFSQGGWDAWFSMTQTPTNNPYGAYLAAKIELDSRIAQKVGLQQQQLNWNQGFLSFKQCDGTELPDIDPMTGKPTGKKTCIGTEKVVTPGATIKGQLDKVLPSGLDKLVTAQHLDQLISAFAAGLLQRYVFGPKGLFNKTAYAGEEGRGVIIPKPNPNDPPGSGTGIDIDGDKVPDGADTDGDGELDICYFGGTDTTLGPPCKGSKESIDEAEGGGGGSGGQCSATGNVYGSNLGSAINAILSANPGGIADKPNLEDANGFKTNGKQFMILVAQELTTQGFNATAEVLNGNSNPNKGEDIALWKSSDMKMERYATLAGGGTDPATAKTIRQSISIEFTGFIPLGCTPSGGSKDCGCKTDNPPPPPPPPPT